MGLTTGVRFRTVVDPYLRHNIWSPQRQCVTGSLSLWVNLPERVVDNSPPSRTEIKNVWRFTSTPTIRLSGVMLSIELCILTLRLRKQLGPEYKYLDKFE